MEDRRGIDGTGRLAICEADVRLDDAGAVVQDDQAASNDACGLDLLPVDRGDVGPEDATASVRVTTCAG